VSFLLFKVLVHQFSVGFYFLLSILPPDVSGLVDELLSSETSISHESLDFGSLLSLLAVFVGPGSPDHVLLDDGNTIILLVAEQFP